jgi:hypothetical protein
MSKDAVPSGKIANSKAANSSRDQVSQAELVRARQSYRERSERLLEMCQEIQKGARPDAQALSLAVAEFTEARVLRDTLEQLLAELAKEE